MQRYIKISSAILIAGCMGIGLSSSIVKSNDETLEVKERGVINKSPSKIQYQYHKINSNNLETQTASEKEVVVQQTEPQVSPTPTPVPIVEKAEVIVEEVFEPYDIPLSTEIQEYTYELCKERGLEFEIVLALMFAESSYRPSLISKTNDYGIMQINKCNHQRLKSELGITDFLDVKQNIDAGTYLLSELAAKYPDNHKMLMAYNFGEGGAKKHWNNGVYSSKYSRNIVGLAEEIKNGD